tara:strand:+ start:10366 stop:10863 length:498 start_codon:yes stop_codon:yes gene_type:complete
MEYIEQRKDAKYYKKCNELIERIAMDNKSKSIIDIGGWNGFFVKNTPIDKKVCLDKINREPEKGVEFINADFLKWNAKEKYDIVLCMQVLEHLEDDQISPFIEKLFSLTNHVIISVPYKWRKGWCKFHKQDPIDHGKLKSWTNRRPFESYLVKDGKTERLICYYK